MPPVPLPLSSPESVVEPVPPLATVKVPESVSEPLEVIGPPVNERPVVPPDASTEVTEPPPEPPRPSVEVARTLHAVPFHTSTSPRVWPGMCGMDDDALMNAFAEVVENAAPMFCARKYDADEGEKKLFCIFQ